MKPRLGQIGRPLLSCTCGLHQSCCAHSACAGTPRRTAPALPWASLAHLKLPLQALRLALLGRQVGIHQPLHDQRAQPSFQIVPCSQPGASAGRA